MEEVRMSKLLTSMLVLAMVFTIGCKSKAPAEGEELKSEEGKETSMTETKGWAEPTEAAVETGKKYTAVIKTSKGDIEVELFANDAPLSVTNFKYLADGGYYNGLTFHRVEPGFVIQGGDPTGTGSGGPGYTIPAEIKRPHPKGALAWARTGDAVNPERRSSGSQFYITLDATPFLDGSYTVFGQTTKGMEVVERIQRGDKIESIVVKSE
jgi:cyclophilin family peptidyl-prolyl cis-trans isomerase